MYGGHHTAEDVDIIEKNDEVNMVIWCSKPTKMNIEE
jgi:hypothetical protein